MAEIMTLPDTGLLMEPEIFEQMGLHPGDSVVIEIEKDRVTIGPVQIDPGTQKLLERLRLPAGSLKDRVVNPDDQIRLEDEIGGTIVG